MRSASMNHDVANLVDLIEHEPKHGGFLGVKEDHWGAISIAGGLC